MEIAIFISGFVLGAIGVYIPLHINRKTMLEQINLHFENTANKVIKDSSTTLTEQNSEKLEEFFKRFKDKIEDFEKKADENLKNENENFTRLDLNIKNFIETGNKINQDTTNLANIMKSDNKTSGKWGEIILERVLEASGLRKGEEFDIQKSAGSGIADAIINLPENLFALEIKSSKISLAIRIVIFIKVTKIADFVDNGCNIIVSIASNTFSQNQST